MQLARTTRFDIHHAYRAERKTLFVEDGRLQPDTLEDAGGVAPAGHLMGRDAAIKVV
ncbi:hypothetical protein BGC_01170 [Burkholderia sp. 3C]